MNPEQLLRGQERGRGRAGSGYGLLLCYVECIKNQTVRYLSERSSSNHLQDLKVFLVQAHLLHFGSEGFGCGEKETGFRKQDTREEKKLKCLHKLKLNEKLNKIRIGC